MSEIQIYVKPREIVVPGDVVARGPVALSSPYLIKLNDGRVVATITGLIDIEQSESGAKLKLIPLKGRYLPKEGDLVVGIVADLGVTAAYVDIRAPFLGVLPASDLLGRPFNPSQDSIQKYISIGDVVAAKIVAFDRTRDPLLTIQDKGLGKVVGGTLIEVEPSRVPRIIGKRRSMITMLTETTGCQFIVGANGRIVISCPNEDLEFISILALKKIEEEAHTQGLTDRVKQFIIEEKIRRGLISYGEAEAHS